MPRNFLTEYTTNKKLIGRVVLLSVTGSYTKYKLFIRCLSVNQMVASSRSSHGFFSFL